MALLKTRARALWTGTFEYSGNISGKGLLRTDTKDFEDRDIGLLKSSSRDF